MKIAVHVKPSSKISKIEEIDDGSFVVHLKSAPVDGKANKELFQLLSKYLHVPQRSIVIKQGGSGKKKLIEILD